MTKVKSAEKAEPKKRGRKPKTGEVAGASGAKESSPVRFQGAVVLEIIEKRERDYHCRMDNGTTMWIPKENFPVEEGEDVGEE